MFGIKNPLAPKRERLFTVLDIGTENVKALVCLEQGKEVHILGRGMKRQNPGEMESGTITDIAGVIEHCHAAMREAERMAGVSPGQLVLGVSGLINILFFAWPAPIVSAATAAAKSLF